MEHVPYFLEAHEERREQDQRNQDRQVVADRADIDRCGERQGGQDQSAQGLAALEVVDEAEEKSRDQRSEKRLGQYQRGVQDGQRLEGIQQRRGCCGSFILEYPQRQAVDQPYRQQAEKYLEGDGHQHRLAQQDPGQQEDGVSGRAHDFRTTVIGESSRAQQLLGRLDVSPGIREQEHALVSDRYGGDEREQHPEEQGNAHDHQDSPCVRGHRCS